MRTDSYIRRLGPDAAAVLTLLALAMAWYAPGLFQHQVYYAEDVVSYFYSTCYRVHDLVHGPGLSLWDPLFGLGMPRFGNMDFCYYSPTSLLFYLLPTSVAFGIYPTLELFGLSLGCYTLFRLRGATPVGALYGAISWCTIGVILEHMQHIAVMDTLLWLCPTLCAWERFRQTGHGGWAAAAAVGVTLQIFGASPQYLVYNMLLCAAWVAVELWPERGRRLLHMSVAAVALLLCGLLLGSVQLLPAAELAGLSQRHLLPADSDFADSYRSAPWEVALSLAREVFIVPHLDDHFKIPDQVYATTPYPNFPALSILTVMLALLALVRAPRQTAVWWGLSVLALLGMLGQDGPVIPVVRVLIPVMKSLRAPGRLIVPAGFMLSWLAATGLDRLKVSYRVAAVAWLIGSGWFLLHGNVHFLAAQEFEPPLPASAMAPRLVVDGSAGLWMMNSGVMVGCSTLLPVMALIPQETFGALVASQFGRIEPAELEMLIDHHNMLELSKVELPIMRAFGVRTQLLIRNGRLLVHRLPALPSYWMVSEVRAVGAGDARWQAASATDWDPQQVAWVAPPLPVLPSPAAPSEVLMVDDGPDEQVVQVNGGGGLLLASAQWYPGWQVTVDDQPATGVEADLALRAVVVPAGQHRVCWRFRPVWWPTAEACVAVGLLGLIGLSWKLRLK